MKLSGRLFVLLCSVLTASFQAWASITIAISALSLRDASGTLIPNGSGLVVLVASTQDASFNDPTPSAFASGDDIVLQKWSVNFAAGYFDGTAGGLTLSGQWNAGDPLKLFWFPSLNESSTSPGAGASYGGFRNDSPEPGTSADSGWFTPADGSTISLGFLTSDNSGGTRDPFLGRASFPVVPEPATYATLFGATTLAAGLLLRRRRRA